MRTPPVGRPSPTALQGQQTAGGREQHSTVYRGRSQLTPGAPRGRKPGPGRRTARVEHSCGSISRLGLLSPRDKVGPQSGAKGGGQPQPRASRRAPALLHPPTPRPGSSHILGGVRGRACGHSLGVSRASQRANTHLRPARTSQRPTRQLPDFRKAAAGGAAAEERAAPFGPERGKRSAPGPSARPGGSEKAARRSGPSAHSAPRPSGRSAALSARLGGLWSGGGGDTPPRRLRGGRGRLPGR